MVMAGIAATSGLRSLTPKGEAFATSRLRNIRYGLRIPPEPGRTVVGNGRQPTLAVQVRDCGRRERAGLRCQIGPLPSEASNLMHEVRGVVPGDFAWGPLHRATCTMPLGANPAHTARTCRDVWTPFGNPVRGAICDVQTQARARHRGLGRGNANKADPTACRAPDPPPESSDGRSAPEPASLPGAGQQLTPPKLFGRLPRFPAGLLPKI